MEEISRGRARTRDEKEMNRQDAKYAREDLLFLIRRMVPADEKQNLAFYFLASWRFGLLFFFAVSSACAPANHPITVKPYVAAEKTAIFHSSGDPFVLFVPPVKGTRERLWYSVRDKQWFLNREPPALIREALVVELQSMKFVLTDELEGADARLDAEITWFSPDGGKPLSAGVIISLSLYEPGAAQPLWRGRLQGGCTLDSMPLLESAIPERMGHALSEAIEKAVRKLRWDPTFPEAIERMRSLLR
jgi:hypothetical protein